MEERRKIVVPVGSPPETPHFDAEETLLSARPVVPIAPGQVKEDFRGEQARATVARSPFYRRFSFIALVVIAAIGVGLAAGLTIARYQQETTPAVVAQPAQAPGVNDTRAATSQTQTDKQQAQSPELPEVKIKETTATVGEDEADKSTESEEPRADSTKASRAAAEKNERDSKRADDEKEAATPPAQREKRRTREDDNDEPAEAPRAQRRERRVRDRRDDTVDVPRRMERASEQINRIREIFEGSQRP